MKLNEIKGEQALDVLADIMIPACDIAADPALAKKIDAGDPKVVVVAYVLKNHKKQVLEIMARLDGEDPARYSPNLLALPKKVLEIVNDPEIMAFFTSQGQTEDEELSGSATESTGATATT